MTRQSGEWGKPANGETRWWLVRHAPVINPSGAIYGQRDVEANTTNGAVFAAVAASLPRDAVWLVTPLRRTQQTAAALQNTMPEADRPDAPPIVVPGLMEQSLGDWQGRSRQEIYDGADDLRHPFWLSPARFRPPNGESFLDLMARVHPVVEHLSDAHRGNDVVAVAHGGTIRAALALALDLDPETALRFEIDTVSVTRMDHLRFDGERPAWRVGGVNWLP